VSIYIPAKAAPVKAGPIGSGAGVLLTEYPLFSFLGKDPHTKMRTAYQMGWNTPWIRTAERAIGSKVATVDVDLNDPEGVEIDATYPNPDAVAAWALLDKPQALLGIGQPLSRSSLLRLLSRHLGLAGNGFLLQDQPEAFAGTPKGLAYLRPDRLTPNDDSQGNLKSWQIDKTPTSPGIEVSLEQIIHFMLEPPDSGHFGVGLVETALLMAQVSTNLDRHIASVLQAGGRLSGFISPKEGVIQGEQLLQMERDWRTITEQPDAAKRIQLIAAPIEFQQTTMTPDQLAIVELMKLMRDDLFVVWNVPGTIVGVAHSTGLNSGDSRKYDEAALWQGPVHDRLVILGEGLQDSIIDKWQKRLGWTPDLILEEPEFDDDSPRYDLLGKSINIAMRNSERRALIGLDPFNDPGVDDAVWLPATMVPAFQAPDENGKKVQMATGEPTVIGNTEPASDAAMGAAGETTAGKANLIARLEPMRRSLLALRDSIATHHTPRIREAVAGVLREQRTEIAQRIRGRASHIAANPKDTSVWWDGKRWDQALRSALVGGLAGMATSVSRQVAEQLPAKADPIGETAVDRVLSRGVARVTKINDTTRGEIADILVTAIDQGVDLAEVADAIEAGTDLTPLIGRSGGVVGDLAYRAEMIARTELMDAYNAAALYSYGDAGVRTVQAMDGDQDEECAARDGREFPIEEADGIEDHPNGTLDWVPVLDFAPVKASLRGTKVQELLSELQRDEQAQNATLQRTLSDVAKAMTTQAERPVDPVVYTPPVINVDLSAIAAAFDRFAETIRNQPPAPAPIVNVPAPVVNYAPPRTRKVVSRDAAGNITEVRDELL
jgi:hypothetical protein